MAIAVPGVLANSTCLLKGFPIHQPAGRQPISVVVWPPLKALAAALLSPERNANESYLPYRRCTDRVASSSVFGEDFYVSN